MSQTTPQVADTEASESVRTAPRVRILVTAVPGSDLDAALAVVGRQAYEPAPRVVVVGSEGELPADVDSAETLEQAIADTDSSVDYLWLLHADARPRPDALAALVSEIERNEASLAGSKLLRAGTMDELESVGGATDVFGEPYSGLDEGEIDLQQYDVVREVAFVQSASMLVRRDLAQGLRGLDPLLPPVAAGLDFSQRTRLAGGKVISVPSSEVYHQGRCGEGTGGRREQAGRLRAMLTAYSPLTLLWVVPYDLMVSLLDSVASLLLLRWRPLVRHLYSWAWNLYHLPSTFRQRRRLRTVRSEGDEELFRFHAKGSLRLRTIGEEVSGRLLSMFDDDQALARGTRRVWGSPGIWGAVIAAILVALGARSLLFTGLPATGFAFPFEPPTVSLERWFGGWNDAGLGSGSAVHPSVGVTGFVSLLWFGAEGAARVVFTLLLAMFGLVGMGRLGGRLGLRGPGRYLAGIALLSGPGVAALSGRASWLALAGAATLPWAVRAVFAATNDRRDLLRALGWSLLTGLMVASMSPALAVVPLLFLVVWRAIAGERGSYALALAAAAGGIAGAAFVIGSPGWLVDPSGRLGVAVGEVWPVLLLAAAVPLFIAEARLRVVALTGGILGLSAMTLSRLGIGGPGVEEAVLIAASFGTAVVLAAALDSFGRSIVRMGSAVAAIAILVVSFGTISNGRLGLPAGDLNDRLAFAVTLAEEGGPGRVLQASADAADLAGQARRGPGFWYRVLDGQGTTHDEVWLPVAGDGDEELSEALFDIAAGAELRPGARLARFGIQWLVLEGSSFRLDQVMAAQLDLIPTPLDEAARVFENQSPMPIAGTNERPWSRAGTGFSGEPFDGRLPIAMSFDPRWGPDSSSLDWQMTVDASLGEAEYGLGSFQVVMAVVTIIAAAGAVVVIVIGRRQ